MGVARIIPDDIAFDIVSAIFLVVAPLGAHARFNV
jgi:hypothetical protein